MSREALIVFYGLFVPYLFGAVVIAGCYLHILLFGTKRNEADCTHKSPFQVKLHAVSKEALSHLKPERKAPPQ